jgi:hypothetical protein
LIGLSVFSNVYMSVSLHCPFWLPLRYSLTFICQFPCIVHFWLSLRYSLTFIIYKALHSDSVNGVYAIDKDIYL